MTLYDALAWLGAATAGAWLALAAVGAAYTIAERLRARRHGMSAELEREVERFRRELAALPTAPERR